MRLKDTTYALILVMLLVVILIYGKHILLPFVLAIMTWLLIRSIRSWVEKIKLGRFVIPRWIQNILVFLVLFSSVGIVSKMLSVNIVRMSDQLPSYQKNIEHIMHQLETMLSIDIVSLVEEYFGKVDVSYILKSVFNSISEIFGDAFMVVLYVVFLMLEENIFMNKIDALATNPEQQKKTRGILQALDQSINSYILLKTLVSLITAFLSYIVLLLIGVDFAFFWAFLIFILNFIPTIGSLIATFFPASMALIQSGETAPFLWVLVCIGSIQLIVGNIVEPKVMGNSLNISSLVVLIALTFWGSIWGVVGMILSVPITVMLIIVLAQFDKTRKAAILLSEKGKV